MKILITTDLFTTRTNGVVTSTHNLIHDLKRRGHDVRVITFSKNGKSWKEDNVYYIKSMSLEWIYPEVRMNSSRASKYVKEIVEWCPDVIHSQCEYFTYAFAKRVAKKTGAPIIHTYHTMYEDYVTYVFPFKRLGAWIVRKFIRSRLKHAYAVIAPTEKVKASLVNFCKIKNRIAIIPSGISLDKHKIRISEEERKEGRGAFGLTDEHFVLFNLGRLGTEKNIQELISYFAKISKRHENARLLLVGGGPAREELEELAKNEGVRDKVIFAGMVDPDTVARYYQLGDLFVCASTSETQGLTYIEAAANGLPLLCRNDPCLDGVIEDGKNGYRYESFEEFESHIDNVIANPEWLKSAGEASDAISHHFDRKVFGGRVEALYEEAIADSKTAKKKVKSPETK